MLRVLLAQVESHIADTSSFGVSAECCALAPCKFSPRSYKSTLRYTKGNSEMKYKEDNESVSCNRKSGGRT